MPPPKPEPAERKLWHSAWDEERGSRYYWRRGAGRKIEYQLGASLLGGRLFFDAQFNDARPRDTLRPLRFGADLCPCLHRHVLGRYATFPDHRGLATLRSSARLALHSANFGMPSSIARSFPV